MSLSRLESALLCIHSAHKSGALTDNERGTMKDLVLQEHDGALSACEAFRLNQLSFCLFFSFKYE